ncbi:MAG: hypothetical protein K2M04_07740 [Muribaculaceae bacterium]|nr:hypothetical protein [Muribaculaceae bacterium]
MNYINKISILALGAVATMLTACDDNSWNDHLDGFDGDPAITQVENINYTLTDADYATISSALVNMATTDEEKAAARSVASALAFSSAEQAQAGIPSLLANSSFPYFALDNGSSVKVTYNVAEEQAEQCKAINAGVTAYTVTKADFQDYVWESKLDYVQSFTPNHPAADYLPTILTAQVKDPQEGQYVMVSYPTSTQNPDFGTAAATAASFAGKAQTRAISDERLTSVLGTVKKNDKVDVVGVVTGICTRGYILADNSGAVLVYQASGFEMTDVKFGDIVSIADATIGAYNKGLQIAIASSDDYIVEGTMSVALPTATPVSGAAAIEALNESNDVNSQYVEITVIPYQDGSYLNFQFEGTPTADVKASLYQQNGTSIAETLAANIGNTVVIRGWTVGVNAKNKLYNILATDVKEKPATPLTSVIDGLKKNDEATVTGIVTAICANGFILTDNSGSILVYQSKNFNPSDVALGNVVTVPNNKVGAYNNGLQLAISGPADYTIDGNVSLYTYPAPVTYNGAMIDEIATNGISADFPATYIEIEATPFMSGTYYNFSVEGCEKATGSFYGLTADDKAMLDKVMNKTVVLRGYYMSYNTKSNFFNLVLTEVEPPKVSVESTNGYALYQWNGTAWVTVSDTQVLQGTDYTAMGASDDAITTPSTLLPVYLKSTLPYAQAGATTYVVYNTSSGVVCAQYTYDGTAWAPAATTGEATDQFVRADGTWKYDPSVVINLPASKSAFEVEFYQACVDWVYYNICVPLGDTSIKSGKFYVSSYGNNEYYAGTSAYYCNVDLRADKAIDQYPAGFEGLSNDEVLQLMKEHLVYKVFPGALATLYPDAKPVSGVDVTYTINFVVYTGSNSDGVCVYDVVGPGQFKIRSTNLIELGGILD